MQDFDRSRGRMAVNRTGKGEPEPGALFADCRLCGLYGKYGGCYGQYLCPAGKAICRRHGSRCDSSLGADHGNRDSIRYPGGSRGGSACICPREGAVKD